MQLTSTLCAVILAATAVSAAASPAPLCGAFPNEIPCKDKRDLDFHNNARRAAFAEAEAWCGQKKAGFSWHEMPCRSVKRTAEAFYEDAVIAKREAETSPEAMAEAWCGQKKAGFAWHEMPCKREAAAEAIAAAYAEAEANPQPLPDGETFADAWCEAHPNESPCNLEKRDASAIAEAVPEAWCGQKKAGFAWHEMPCKAKREDILRREYVAALALKKL